MEASQDQKGGGPWKGDLNRNPISKQVWSIRGPLSVIEFVFCWNSNMIENNIQTTLGFK